MFILCIIYIILPHSRNIRTWEWLIARRERDDRLNDKCLRILYKLSLLKTDKARLLNIFKLVLLNKHKKWKTLTLFCPNSLRNARQRKHYLLYYQTLNIKLISYIFIWWQVRFVIFWQSKLGYCNMLDQYVRSFGTAVFDYKTEYLHNNRQFSIPESRQEHIIISEFWKCILSS